MTVEQQSPNIPVSPELTADPSFRPQLGGELKRVFDHLATEEPDRFEAAIITHQQLGPPCGPVEDLRCVGMGVVDGAEEHEHIFHTLTQFAKQDAPPGSFELLLLVNTHRSSTYTEESSVYTNFQKTISEIERFKARHPTCPVRYAARLYEEQQTISNIRADLLEVAAYDLWTRGRQGNLLALFVDADAQFMNSQFITSLTSKYEQIAADIVTSRLVIQPVPELPHDSAVNHLLRLQSLQYQLITNHRDRPLTSGPDTAIDFATILAAGSIDRTHSISEVSLLCRAIFALRQSKEVDSLHNFMRAEQEREALLKTNPRRLVAAMALGVSLVDAWRSDNPRLDFTNNPKIRSQPLDFLTAEANAQAHCAEWTDDLFADANVKIVPQEVLEHVRAFARRRSRFDIAEPNPIS